MDKSTAYLSFCKRSTVHYKEGNYEAAIRDAAAAINLKPDYGKGFQARAVALVALEQFMLARDDYLRAVELLPDNAGIKEKLDEVMYIIKALEIKELPEYGREVVDDERFHVSSPSGDSSSTRAKPEQRIVEIFDDVEVDEETEEGTGDDGDHRGESKIADEGEIRTVEKSA